MPKTKAKTKTKTKKKTFPSSKLPGDFSAEEYGEIYTLLLRCRMLDERMRKLFKQGRFAGTYFSAVGQEATTVVPAYFLKDGDFVGPSHRELGASVARGVPFERILAQLYARANSPDKGKAHPCHYHSKEHGIFAPASTVAAQLMVATGAAWAFQLQKKDNVAMAWTGEGGTSRGDWHEALNFAGVRRLPMVYITQNNFWAESVPVSHQVGGAVYKRAEGYGFPGYRIEGNDVPTVMKYAREAVQRARSGEGPTLLEMLTYRHYGHSEIDPANYRTQEEWESWVKKDPVPNFEKLLMQEGIVSEKDKERIAAEIEGELEKAIAVCESQEYVPVEEILNDVWVDFKVDFNPDIF